MEQTTVHYSFHVVSVTITAVLFKVVFRLFIFIILIFFFSGFLFRLLSKKEKKKKNY